MRNFHVHPNVSNNCCPAINLDKVSIYLSIYLSILNQSTSSSTSTPTCPNNCCPAINLDKVFIYLSINLPFRPSQQLLSNHQPRQGIYLSIYPKSIYLFFHHHPNVSQPLSYHQPSTRYLSIYLSIYQSTFSFRPSQQLLSSHQPRQGI